MIMQPRMPQKLIDTIVHEVVDTASLKACSLAPSNFRVVSQRILLGSVKLCRLPRNYRALCWLLSESPHITTYITTFHIQITPSKVPLPAYHMRELLDNPKLMNVRHCIITGNSPGTTWGERDSILLMVPYSMVALFVSSAPALIFDNVFVITDDDTVSAEGTVVMSELLLCEKSESICELLGRPEFSHYAANLRRLALRAYYRYSGGIISAAACTLEHLRFECESQSLVGAFMPTFPSLSTPTPLRTIDLVASIYAEP
ncbi:hypothetical protein B0H17DRAFT_1202437 [Mycena rosella]|uniref:F-box domain-containing protein n=1 Tax=Mycena rosella TaxID=1033263 RepID=A0AAD7DEH7_MYCRO|nr:hypothetical protein B0H17DRAFT_1202437 [Mycena rosella]